MQTPVIDTHAHIVPQAMLKPLRGNNAHYGVEFSGSKKQTLVQLAGSLDTLKRRYFDQITFSAATLRYLIDLVGVDRLMLGSDYPFEMGDPDPVGSIDVVLPEENRASVLGGTVQKIMCLTPACGWVAVRWRRSRAIDLGAHVCIDVSAKDESRPSCLLNRCTPKRTC